MCTCFLIWPRFSAYRQSFTIQLSFFWKSDIIRNDIIRFYFSLLLRVNAEAVVPDKVPQKSENERWEYTIIEDFKVNLPNEYLQLCKPGDDKPSPIHWSYLSDM